MVRMEILLNLEVLLDEVIEEYGENTGYYKPAISWSNFNRLASYEKYRYWENSVEINPFLNNKNISKDTLKSVIYNEYLHQIYSGHGKAFKKKSFS